MRIKIILMTVLLSMVTGKVMASSTTYYYKATATATPTGAGKVYASNKAPTGDPTEQESTFTGNATETNVKLYFNAKPAEGYIFKGWGESADAISYISSDALYTPTITISSTDKAAPSTVQYFAIFGRADAPQLTFTTNLVTIQEGETFTSPEPEQENITDPIVYSSNNQAVAQVTPEGVVTGVGNGTTEIKATSGEAVASYLVTVTRKDAGSLQLINGDFESWSIDGVHLPNNWNSFQTADGSLASMAYSATERQVQQSKDVRPGSNGKYSARIWAKNVMGLAIAQGNLTTGRVHAGSTSAASKDNYNYSDRDGSNTINGKVNPCAMTFNGRPTAISLWVKFKPAKAVAANPYALLTVAIHDDYDFISAGAPQYDTDENKSHLVAKAQARIVDTKGEWKNIVVPFGYTTNEIDPAYIILNLSTNADPGKGTAQDELLVDDIEMVYGEDTGTANMTITETGMATFVAPFEVSLPVEINASRVTAVQDNGLLTMEPLSTSIPANTPVIVQSKYLTNMTFRGGSAASTEETCTDGILTGALTKISAPMNSYVLQNINGKLGFYLVDSAIEIPANRAYLQTSGNVKAYYFDEQTTGIQDLRNTEHEGATYNLAGQRINKVTRGVYINNGKKILK